MTIEFYFSKLNAKFSKCDAKNSKLKATFSQCGENPYIMNFIEYLSGLGINDCVLIMDNVAFHKVEEIRNFIAEKQFKLMYLSPYSSFLNPIENLFSKWKQEIRSRNKTKEETLKKRN
ncbi:hypothetical protein ENBRE01_2199 [Enteropsectra breve]|nr:hypothetical protein ENBRE01_2199 [Enteropsectra breve]